MDAAGGRGPPSGPRPAACGPEQLLIHTEQSSQYRASDHCTLLSEHGISCCISAKGCCWGNAVVERFFSTLTLELDLYEIKTL